MAVSVPGGPDYAPANVQLAKIDPGLTSPSGDYRWLDVADNEYAASFHSTYDYSQASVQVTYETQGTSLQGTLVATNLKPNFAYQLKLTGTPDTQDNERIGLSGRWWEETWDGSQWSNGHNLNNKGDGSSPNPNDDLYFSRKDVQESSSPTGKLYRYTGYMPIDYFITNESGSASLSFEADSCYHVLWKTSQRAPNGNDGPLKMWAFDPDPLSTAYDFDYPESSATIFGEWERLPVGGVYLRPGSYSCMITLTEESFHGNGLAGGWASAMGATISFDIEPTYTLSVSASPVGSGTTSPSPGAHGCAPNQVFLLEAYPASGYEFSSWGGNVAQPYSSSTRITMTADETVTAYFQPAGTTDPPDAPSNLAATAEADGTVTLSWQDNSNDELGFAIDRKTATGYFHEIDRVAANTTTYHDQGVTGGRTYVYRVKAWKYVEGPLGPTEVSSSSNQVSVTTSSDGGCFIASAAYGSYFEPQVDTLRSFRDGFLQTDAAGTGIVSAYYEISPPIADFIDAHPSLKPIVKAALAPAVVVSDTAVDGSIALKAVIGSVALFVAFVSTVWVRRRIALSKQPHRFS